MKCRIESVGVALPPTGSSDFNSSIKLAVDAARACLSTSNHLVYEIGYLVYTGICHEEYAFKPATAAFIQNELKMNTDFMGRQTLSFDLMNGASGMLSGIRVVIAAIENGAIRAGMVVSSAVCLDQETDNSYSYYSSGSAVIIDLSPDLERGFGSFVFRTFNDYSDLYHEYVDFKVKEGAPCIQISDYLEEKYLEFAPKVFDQLLDTEGVLREEVGLVLASQISPGFLRRLAESLGLPLHKVLDVSRILGGVTQTTSPFIALDYALKNDLIAQNMKTAFMTIGSDATVGSVMYYS